MLSYGRRLLKTFHPQGIPWPGTVLYNAVSKTSVFQYHYELVAREISHYCSAGRMLDIGTGPGWLLLKVHQYSPQLKLTAVDISAAMVSKAKTNITRAGLSNLVDIKKGAAGDLPFNDNSFDIIVSTGSMHHWNDPVAGLNDVYRVLKPESYALMYDLVSDMPGYLLREFSQKFGKIRTMIYWLHSFEEPFYSIEVFKSLASSSLFREAQTRFVGALFCLILRK